MDIHSDKRPLQDRLRDKRYKLGLGMTTRNKVADHIDALEAKLAQLEGVTAKNRRIAITEPMILVIRYRPDGSIADVSEETESTETVRIFALGASPPKPIPNGYAVTMPDESSPTGFWFVGAWCAQDVAIDMAKRQGRGSRMRPITFADTGELA